MKRLNVLKVVIIAIAAVIGFSVIAKDENANVCQVKDVVVETNQDSVSAESSAQEHYRIYIKVLTRFKDELPKDDVDYIAQVSANCLYHGLSVEQTNKFMQNNFSEFKGRKVIVNISSAQNDEVIVEQKGFSVLEVIFIIFGVIILSIVFAAASVMLNGIFRNYEKETLL